MPWTNMDNRGGNAMAAAQIESGVMPHCWPAPVWPPKSVSFTTLIMIVGQLISTTAVLAAAISLALAEVPEGRIYVLHSGAVGACPSLDWHIVLEPNGILAGMISWNGMKTMARVTGTVNQRSHTFTMVAKEMEGRARNAKVKGQIREDGLIIAHTEGPRGTCDAVIAPSYGNQPPTR